MKPIFQMTREEKWQEIVEYSPCRVERSTVLRYLLALRRNDTEQIAYFESFGKSVRHIILNVRTYERGLIFGYVGKQFNKLDTSNTIHIGQSVDGTYAVSIDWCTGTAGGGSHPSVWDEPVRDYKEAVRQGIRLLERQYNKAECWSVSDRSNYNPKVIRSLKEKLLELKRKYTQPRQLSLF